ncbi:flagellar basal body P-ring formation chaperone FlgA [Rhodanobacter sp. AS-Z3]|uniref:flagellar basal body P-ring formation chaperone FlgA n=1 Tax=Rhodanobacter sp. AS-Z3 TaxID=3031330 RepID=UPI002478F29A|nr:flagellar basal body P-ring formation chaperone FlgA [Rhodanobacter sp. AS-Z3]WEN14632.1 flagellar basal body P-ring formation chaperone FlgA [Rhodanobacter sp. AS-Z3]
MIKQLSSAFAGLALLALTSLPVVASAMDGNSTPLLTEIRATAEQAVREHYAAPAGRIEVTTEPLDTRLQLAACTQPLHALISDQTQPRSRMTVAVQCPDNGGWTVRVPIQLQLFRNVLVSSRALLRGDGIRVTDVHAEERDVTKLGYGYLENLDQVAGRSLARAVARGTVLNPATLGGRRMVRAGDHVQMLAQLDGVQVRADGIALGSGDNGARLRVRNANSGRVIDAMVSAPGVVVALP